MSGASSLNRQSPSGTLKLVTLCLVIYAGYKVVKYMYSKDEANKRTKRSPITVRKWTKREISKYTGENDTPVLIAVDRKVYDVSAGRGFYGPEGPYSVFAGRDASRLLATQSFDEGMTESELDAPIDSLDGLTEEDRDSLDSYVGLFSVKYNYVGELVEPSEKTL